MTVLCSTINQSSRKLVVLQKRGPLLKAEVRGNQCGLFLMSFMHQSKKQAGLDRLDLYITQLVNYQTIVGGKRLYHLFFGIITPGFIKYLYEFRKHDESHIIAMINRLNKKGRCKACLSSTCWANPDDVLIF